MYQVHVLKILRNEAGNQGRTLEIRRRIAPGFLGEVLRGWLLKLFVKSVLCSKITVCAQRGSNYDQPVALQV